MWAQVTWTECVFCPYLANIAELTATPTSDLQDCVQEQRSQRGHRQALLRHVSDIPLTL